MNKKNITIFLVDDDPYICNMYNTFFSKMGYNVDVCSDGKEAIAKIKEVVPDIVLLDLILPKIAGFEILKIIKSDKHLKDIPVLMFSNTGRKEDVKKCMEAGAAEYIPKAETPPTELVKIVEKYL